MLKRIMVAPNAAACTLDIAEPYAAVTFVNSARGRGKTAPRMPKTTARFGRIIIRADDCYIHSSIGSTALSRTQALRIATFIHRLALRIETLFVSCRHGQGRSASVALVTAATFGLDWNSFGRAPYVPNGWFVELLMEAFETLGYALPPRERLTLIDPYYSADRLEQQEAYAAEYGLIEAAS